jgi:hypothetical protein
MTFIQASPAVSSTGNVHAALGQCRECGGYTVRLFNGRCLICTLYAGLTCDSNDEAARVARAIAETQAEGHA